MDKMAKNSEIENTFNNKASESRSWHRQVRLQLHQ